MRHFRVYLTFPPSNFTIFFTDQCCLSRFKEFFSRSLRLVWLDAFYLDNICTLFAHYVKLFTVENLGLAEWFSGVTFRTWAPENHNADAKWLPEVHSVSEWFSESKQLGVEWHAHLDVRHREGGMGSKSNIWWITPGINCFLSSNVYLCLGNSNWFSIRCKSM